MTAGGGVRRRRAAPNEAIAWLEERPPNDPRLLPALADFYERDRRWTEAAGDLRARACSGRRATAELKTRYASALLNAGGRDEHHQGAGRAHRGGRGAPDRARRARALSAVAGAAAPRRLHGGRSDGAPRHRAEQPEPVGLLRARRSARGTPSVPGRSSTSWRPSSPEFRGASGDAPFDVSILLPHLGFAYQELGQYDKAIAAFEEARRLSPNDPSVAGYLIDAQHRREEIRRRRRRREGGARAASRRSAAHAAARAGAAARRQGGSGHRHPRGGGEEPQRTSRWPTSRWRRSTRTPIAARRRCKVLQDAQAKFPAVTRDCLRARRGLRQAEEVRRGRSRVQAGARRAIPRTPPRSTISATCSPSAASGSTSRCSYLKKALQIEPENGSFLDSLGWAYFKADKLDLAEENLRRAADQLKTNSVIQDHYGQVLFKLGRYDEAIAAWTRALAGDGDSIDKSDIDKKIRAAKQKLQKR